VVGGYITSALVCLVPYELLLPSLLGAGWWVEGGRAWCAGFRPRTIKSGISTSHCRWWTLSSLLHSCFTSPALSGERVLRPSAATEFVGRAFGRTAAKPSHGDVLLCPLQARRSDFTSTRSTRKRCSGSEPIDRAAFGRAPTRLNSSYAT